MKSLLKQDDLYMYSAIMNKLLAIFPDFNVLLSNMNMRQFISNMDRVTPGYFKPLLRSLDYYCVCEDFNVLNLMFEETSITKGNYMFKEIYLDLMEMQYDHITNIKSKHGVESDFLFLSD